MAISSADKAYLGNISVKVQTPDFVVRGRENLKDFRRDMRIAHDLGIEEGKKLLKETIRDNVNSSSGNLLKSVSSKLFIKTTEIFEGTVHFLEPAKEYAYFVEYGRGPGKKPPIQVMKAWGGKKGMTLWHILNIRAKIGEEGTEAQPFMDEAQSRIQRSYNRIIDNAVERFRNRDL